MPKVIKEETNKVWLLKLRSEQRPWKISHVFDFDTPGLLKGERERQDGTIEIIVVPNDNIAYITQVDDKYASGNSGTNGTG